MSVSVYANVSSYQISKTIVNQVVKVLSFKRSPIIFGSAGGRDMDGSGQVWVGMWLGIKNVLNHGFAVNIFLNTVLFSYVY